MSVDGRQQTVGGPVRHVRSESASGPRGHRAQPDAGRTPPPDLSHDPWTWTGGTTTREPLKPRAGILRIERAAGGTGPAPMHPDAARRRRTRGRALQGHFHSSMRTTLPLESASSQSAFSRCRPVGGPNFGELVRMVDTGAACVVGVWL